MKSHYKIFLSLAFGLSVGLAGCQDDEVLDLQQFPENQPQITIDGEEGATTSTIHAVYQSDGSLSLDGLVSRNYTFNFAPSPEDAIVNFELINSNIPAEKVSLSTQQTTIPAGFVTTGVAVTLKDEDFSFARENYEETTYELGVKAIVQGYKIGKEPVESKVIIKKEAYKASCYIELEEGQESYFKRSYFNQSIIEEPVAVSFRAKLDKPARKDVKVRFATTGIKEQFAKDITFTPSEVIIPAGKLASDTITWTVSNDFLLETDQPETFDIKIKATYECEDPVVSTQEELSTIALKVDKKKIYINPNGNLDKFNQLATDSYTVTFNGENIDYVSDNNMDTFAYNQKTVTLVFDLQSVQNLIGISYGTQKGFTENKPRNVKVEVSNDGEEYTDLGVFVIPANPSQDTAEQMTPIELYGAMSCKFIQLTFEKTAYTGVGGWMEMYYDTPAISEVRLYTK